MRKRCRIVILCLIMAVILLIIIPNIIIVLIGYTKIDTLSPIKRILLTSFSHIWIIVICFCVFILLGKERTRRMTSIGLYTTCGMEKYLKSLDVKNKEYTAVFLQLKNREELQKMFGTEAYENLVQKMLVYIVSKIGNDEAGVMIKYTNQLFLIFSCDIRTAKKRLVEIKKHISQYQVELGKITYEYHPLCIYGLHKITEKDELTIKYLSHITEMNSYISINSYSLLTEDEEKKHQSKLTSNINSLLIDVDNALQNNEFIPYFQTVNNIQSGEVVGAELTVKWDHPEYGLLESDIFEGVLELSGNKYDMDMYLIDEACELIKYWIDKEVMPVPLSVKISSNDLFVSGFMDSITEILEKHKVPPIMLDLVFSGQKLYVENKYIFDILSNLTQKGIKISVDDMGGCSISPKMFALNFYSVRSDIKRLIVTKNNKSIENEPNYLITKSFTQIIHMLNAVVIATNLDSEEAAAMLNSAECTMAQGSLFLNPMPKKDYEKTFCYDINDLKEKDKNKDEHFIVE